MAKLSTGTTVRKASLGKFIAATIADVLDIMDAAEKVKGQVWGAHVTVFTTHNFDSAETYWEEVYKLERERTDTIRTTIKTTKCVIMGAHKYAVPLLEAGTNEPRSKSAVEADIKAAKKMEADSRTDEEVAIDLSQVAINMVTNGLAKCAKIDDAVTRQATLDAIRTLVSATV